MEDLQFNGPPSTTIFNLILKKINFKGKEIFALTFAFGEVIYF